MELSLSNVINISVSAAQSGVNAYNPSNLALFTTDTPDPVFDDGYKIYKEPAEVGTDFGTSSITYEMAVAVFSQNPNILANGGSLIVIPFEASEALDDAITRTSGLVQYFGVMSTQIESQVDMLAAGAIIQALNKIGFFVQRASGSIDPGGSLDLLRTGSLWKSRGLYYGSDNDDDALLYQAAYAGRALSTVFSGSNTTQTMHLKDLSGIQPDPTMTQTILGKAQDAGADCYVSLQGVSKTFTSGANRYFDQVYNLGWFVGAIEVAGFNYLAQSSTKIPQTESGVDGLKGAYRSVCRQAATNLYVAPGEWTSPTTFGNLADLYENVRQFGYYIYSQPIAEQLVADRADRKAPIIQIGIKEAGAIHSSTVIINVNA